MPVLETLVDPKNDGFRANAASLRAHVGELRDLLARIAEGGGAQARERHVGRGKLLPRERVRLLLDPGAPFVELSPLAGHGLYDEEVPAGGIITGIGQVMGQEYIIVANDATVKGGTYFPITVNKHLQPQEIARQNRQHCIYLADSVDANLPNQEQSLPDR